MDWTTENLEIVEDNMGQRLNPNFSNLSSAVTRRGSLFFSEQSLKFDCLLGIIVFWL